MNNRGVVCLLLLLLAGLWPVPAWSDARGKSYQLLGNLWVSQIGRHEKTVKDLHEALQGDIDNLVRSQWGQILSSELLSTDLCQHSF